MRLAARQADDLQRLEAAIKVDGVSVPGSAGQPVLNPCVQEARQARLAINRLLGVSRCRTLTPSRGRRRGCGASVRQGRAGITLRSGWGAMARRRREASAEALDLEAREREHEWLEFLALWLGRLPITARVTPDHERLLASVVALRERLDTAGVPAEERVEQLQGLLDDLGLTDHAERFIRHLLASRAARLPADGGPRLRRPVRAIA